MFSRPVVVQRALAAVSNVPGTCYLWTRTMAGSPSVGDVDRDGDADAVDGWKATKHRHPGDRNPPAGVPVFWSGGTHGYGHAAVSLGGGKIRSTDAGGPGRIATVDLGWVERTWGLTYLGWTEDLAGEVIPTPTPVKPAKPAKPVKERTAGQITRARELLQRALRRAEANDNTARVKAIRAALRRLNGLGR